ncbi:hypothetical protein JW960_23820 [candidate division KSB1 bacterium]|nr:hypothetical protein [candidate division KSB1 bacterium]
MRSMIVLFFISTIFLIQTISVHAGDELIVNQTSVPLVTIQDGKLIKFFLDEFFIPETLVTRMDIIDVSLNGFGENDIVRLYPSDQIYFLQYVSDKAQAKMNQWKFTANFQITAQNKDISILEDYENNRPAYNIFGSILTGLNKNYKDYPIKIRFERDTSTVIFELWSYNENRLMEIPDQAARLPDKMVEYIKAETDTVYRDCIYIYKSVHDTVFVPLTNTNVN